MIYATGGHTPGTMAILIVEERTLILGDAMEDNPEMHLAMMKYMPLRALIAFGQGKYTEAD